MSAIYLIRHGQASFGGDDYDALSPLGERQSGILGAALAQRVGAPDIVQCGRMRRHAQTAGYCLEAMQLAPDWQVDAGWDEYDHNDMLGAYDARYSQQAAIAADLSGQQDPRAAFQAIFSAAAARWVSGAHDDDYRESWPAFCARVEQALDVLVQRLQRGQTALVFTSGGVIGVVCRRLLGLTDERTVQINWIQANASITKLIVGRGGVNLGSFNEHGHLEQAERLVDMSLVSYR